MTNLFKTRLNQEVLLFDGAMGTMLQKAGLGDAQPDVLNVLQPDIITQIHKQYVAAGSDVITTNTFGANSLKLKDTGFGVEEVIKAAIVNARAAGAAFVVQDIGPLGQMLKPVGTLGFEDAVNLFAKQIKVGVAHGVDALLIETMSDIYEVKSAVVAAKECSDLPIITSLTFDENQRTFMGTDALTAVTFLNAIGVDAIGINCSKNPFEIAPIIDTLTAYSRVPILVMPNAGLPMATGEYSVTPKAFADALLGYYKKGVQAFGGCCGTSPAYIATLKKVFKGKKPKKRKIVEVSAVTSSTITTLFDNKITVIGERINPTGKPKLKEAIKNHDMAFIVNEAITQQNQGATVLDVNCGLPDIDEPKVLARIVEELQGVINLPLQIDSSNPQAIEQAVRIYNGKPLINSVNGEKRSMETIFPIAKKYGAAVIGLTLDENGIPKKAQERFLIAKKIVETAASYGIQKQDIFIDCLVLTASAQQAQVFETIKAIRLIKEKLGVKTVLGVSNVSFGLPNRAYLNGIFLTAAMTAGLDAGIVNPCSEEINSAIKAFRVLNGNDVGASDYIANFSDTSIVIQTASKSMPQVETAAHQTELTSLIGSGQKGAAQAQVRILLQTLQPLEVINNHLVPALNFSGKEYEAGKIFLPQLIQSAESAKACFDVVKSTLGASSVGVSKGKIILATVKGDIHDIGKNIVKVLLQSYGYEVIDLGKDVGAAEIVAQAMTHNVKLIGLSALMTTTIPAMKETIQALSKALPHAKVMVGGAVLNEEYTQFVGADYYANDAMAGVKIAEKVLS